MSTRLPAGSRPYRLGAAIIISGLLGGTFAAAFVATLHTVTHWIDVGGRGSGTRVAILASTGIGVAILVRLLGPAGSVDTLVDNIHVHGGHHALRPLRSLIPTSLLCISAGGTLGPEAPLVEVDATLATWVAVRLGLERRDRRIVTLSGMAAALAVLFGAPFGAAVFALELPHRRGMEYSEAILPACTGAVLGWVTDAVLRVHGWESVWSFGPAHRLGAVIVAWGALAGVVGAAIGVCFTFGVRIARRLASVIPEALRPAIGGVGLGLLSILTIDALTNGEARLSTVVGLTSGTILVAALGKFVGALVASATGWKGGFIIPLFFIGGAVGIVLARAFGIAPIVLAPACMVATNAAVTRTPLGSALAVAEMSGMPTLPGLFAASVVSTVLTDGVRHFASQGARTDASATAVG